MGTNQGDITAQARELKLKAQTKALQGRITSLEKCLTETEVCVNELHKEKLELLEQISFLKGQIEAYEKVLSHMIYNASGVDDDIDIGCGSECNVSC